MLQASKLEGLLSAFDQSNSLYALSTPDGRVRIFDTGRLSNTLLWPTGLVGSLSKQLLLQSSYEFGSLDAIIVASCQGPID